MKKRKFIIIGDQGHGQNISIYEIYNPYVANKIYCNFKPNKKDLWMIALKEMWFGNEEEFEALYKGLKISKLAFYSKD